MHVKGDLYVSNSDTTVGISIIPQRNDISGNNSGGRIFFREDNNDEEYGFCVGFNGGPPNDILNWPENTFCVSRHDKSTDGEVSVSINGITGFVGIGTTVSQSKLHVQGNLKVTDTITGNLTVDVDGDVTGNLTGDVDGDVTGNLTGYVDGDVTGNLTGNVTGNLTGDVTGNLTGLASQATIVTNSSQTNIEH